MSERSRTHLYTGLCSVVDDEEAVQEMLAHFPARELDEPVTRDHLRASVSDLRVEIADLRTELRTVAAELRSEMAELRGEMADLKAELRGEMAELRGEMADLKAELRGEMAELRIDMTTGFAAVDRRMAAHMEALRKDVSTTMRNWTLGGLSLVVAATGAVTAVVQAIVS